MIKYTQKLKKINEIFCFLTFFIYLCNMEICNIKVGDTVIYKDKEYCVYDLYSSGLCEIVRIRDGKIINTKGGEERLNASIVNLTVKELEND